MWNRRIDKVATGESAKLFAVFPVKLEQVPDTRPTGREASSTHSRQNMHREERGVGWWNEPEFRPLDLLLLILGQTGITPVQLRVVYWL